MVAVRSSLMLIDVKRYEELLLPGKVGEGFEDARHHTLL